MKDDNDNDDASCRETLSIDEDKTDKLDEDSSVNEETNDNDDIEIGYNKTNISHL